MHMIVASRTIVPVQAFAETLFYLRVVMVSSLHGWMWGPTCARIEEMQRKKATSSTFFRTFDQQVEPTLARTKVPSYLLATITVDLG